MLKVPIKQQPDDTTCGTTCLHAVYEYYGEQIPLEEVIRDVDQFAEGGTLGSLLALDALQRGYDANLIIVTPPKHVKRNAPFDCG